MFVHINPVQLTFDLPSMLWLNSFALNLHESLLRTSVGNSMHSPSSTTSLPNAAPEQKEPNFMYMDVKLEAILPRIVFEAVSDVATSQRDRPKLMQVQISRFQLTNVREMGLGTRADLAQALSSLQEGSLVFSSGFPAKDGDMCVVTDRILEHVAAADVLPSSSIQPPSQIDSPSSNSGSSTYIPRHALWTEPRDVWCIKFDPVWVEFFGARSIGMNKSLPFVDAVPITLWVHGKSSSSDGLSVEGAAINRTADLHAIAHVSNLISVQIDHFQFLFLLRLSEQLTELSTFLTIDRNRILKEKVTDTTMIVGCVIPQIEVTLIMPSATPGKESAAGDGESVIPDSASLADDLQYNTSSQLLRNNTNPFSMSIDSPTSMPIDPLPYETSLTNPTTGIQSGIQLAHPMKSKTNVTETMLGTSGNIPSMTSSCTSSSETTKRNRNSVSDATSFPKDINSGFMSMKKGFSSLMTSIDTALKTGVGTDDLMSDTMSIRSDGSSDSDNFVLTLTDSDKAVDCMDVMFK